MSQDQIAKDIEALKARFGSDPVPLEHLLREFPPFKPHPRGRGRELSPDDRSAAIARLTRNLYTRIQEAVDSGELTVANELPAPLDMLGEAGVIRHLGGEVAEKARGRYLNFKIRLNQKFIAFVGGDERAPGKLGSAYGEGRSRRSAKTKPSKTFPSLVNEAVDRHLAGVKDSAVEAFVKEFKDLYENRPRGGRGSKVDGEATTQAKAKPRAKAKPKT